MLSRQKEHARSLMGEYAALVGDAVLRQRARAAEQEARFQAELVNKIRSEFLANMSHELRTPLNTVMGFSKMITNHKDRPLKDQEIVEYAGIVHEAASHLLKVINDILDISKIQSGRYVLEQRVVEIDEVLRTGALHFRPQAEQAGITLKEDIAANLMTVSGDASKLNQIFSNILSNAIKFTPNGGEVTLTAVNASPDHVAISIRDTGIGMNNDDIDVALTPFGQVDGGSTRWREGTGLGLPIANALVHMHEGVMTIQSTPGAGTEVRVQLPSSAFVSLAQAREALGVSTRL
jgi:two-component system cell cycle sensor histidine kinase PleC